MMKLPPKPQLTATDDWMPEHCIQTNHDDYSFSPLSLSYTSSSEATDEVALPLPPSRLLRHHTLPWSISSDHATLNHNANIGDDSKNLNHDGKILQHHDGRASSPNSVSAFPPSSLAVVPASRRRPRTTDVDKDHSDSSETIVDKMETYLPLCGGASAPVDTNIHQRCKGGGADGLMENSNNRNNVEEREMTVLRGDGSSKEREDTNRQQQQKKKVT